MPSTIMSISLDPLSDSDILEWAANQSNLSESIRQAIRAKMARRSELAAVRQVVEEIREMLRAGVTLGGVVPAQNPDLDNWLSGFVDQIDNGEFG